MADIGTLEFGVHLKDYTDVEADKIKKKLENLSVHLKIDGKNVTISQTDLIKKQIEDAIKSVSVQSVKIDTNAVRTQVNTALQGLNPQVSVSIQKGALSNDLQNYLHTKVFTVGITITRGNAQSAINTAFANISVPVNVTVKASAAIQQLQQALSARNVKIGVEAKNPQDLVNDIEKKLKGRNIKVDIEPNRQHLVQAVKQALQGVSVKAKVDVSVDDSAITRAVQSAINNASFTYSPNGRRSQSGGGRQSGGGSSNGWNPNAQRGLYESARASITLGSSLKTNIRLAGELGTSLGNLASIFGIKDLLTNMVRIGGELENQKIALGAILQDGGKATEMFGKIQSLAVKSPFGIMDLNQYTKQLAAYGIEYNELYDTMKRMADISAGVGVDMGRIILAFGQVKAAGFLKGTELRQFTEANIPMVQALADRFSVLEKRIVSAGEVYDMISEKKVSFEDVKAVLWELTGEGGRFNNMQEVLSESLASKWKNLSDAIDVMYGKIANGTIGDWLKNLAEGLTEVTKQWEYVATAIKSAAAAYLVYRNQMNGKQIVLNTPINNLLASKQKQAEILKMDALYRNLTKAEQLLIKTTGELNIADMKRAIRAGELNRSTAIRLIQLKQLDDATSRYLVKLYAIQRQELEAAVKTNIFRSALTGLWTTIKGVGAALKTMIWNPFTATFAVIGGIAEIFTYYNKKSEEIKQRNEEIAESAKGSAESLERELLKLKDLDISKMNTDEIKIKIKELTTVIKNEAYGWQGILSEIFAKEADGTFKNSVEEQLKLLKTKMEELAEAKKKLMGDNDSYSDVIGKTETGVLFWEKDIIDRVKAYSKAVDENDKILKDLAVHARDVSTAIGMATLGNKELSKSLEGKSLNDQVAFLKGYETEWKKFIVELTKSNSNAAEIVNQWYNNIEKYYVKGKESEMLLDFNKAKKALIDRLILRGEDINNLSEEGRQYVLGFVEGMIKEASVQKPKVQQYIYDWYTGQFGFQKNDLSYNTTDGTDRTQDEYDPSKDEVAKMWKKRSEEIAKAVKMYDQWKKVEGTAKASERVKMNDELSDLFSGAYGFKLDLENPTAAYEYIQSKLNKGLSAQKELMIQLGVKISDAELKDAQDKLKSSVEQLKKDTKKIVEGWDLYEDLFKATGNKDVSMKIAFDGNVGFDNLLKHLESQIKGKMKELGIGISFDELIKKDTKSLEEAGFVGLTDLIETYNKENAKLKDESVKNFLEIIKNSKDFAQQIADIDRKLQTDLSDLAKGLGGTGSAEFERRATELIKKAEEDKVKVNFEEFKKSSDWVKVFDDLNRVSDATLDNMTKKIEEFAKQANLSEEVTKQLVDAMGKLRDEAIERNPFEGFVEAWNRLKYLKGGVVTKSGQVRFGSGTEADPFTFKSKEEVDNEVAEANDDLVDSTMGVIKKFDAVADAANLLSGLFENLGVDLGSFGDIIGGATSGAQTGAGIASALGAAGPWGAIAGAAVGMLSQVFAAHDKALEKEIEASEAREKAIKNMAENLEGLLSKNIGGIYTFKISEDAKKEFEEIQRNYQRYLNAIENFNNDKDIIDSHQIIRQYSHLKEETIAQIGEALSSEKYYDAQKASLMVQRDEIEKQRKAEEEKKKTDANKIADYDQQLREVEQQLKDFALDMANELWGIDFKSWANQLTESLVNAWSKGEDAVLAYKNTVSDILRDLGVSMISQKIIEPLLEDTMNDFLAQFDKDNGELTDNSMKILAGMYEGADKAASATEAYLEGLKKLGVGISETSESSSSGLSKGVQSITENTADLLASYVNAMRVDVSVNRTLFEQLVNESVPRMSMLAESQLTQLRMVADNTRRNADAADRIYELVNRVVDKGSNKLKV